jgi:cytoskeleton protein RodZ
LPGETREHPASPPARERFLSPAVNEGRHSLSLFAKQRTWLVVQADDDRPREIMLLEGEAISLSAERQFRLTIGNAGGVEMVLDGKRLPTVGSSGQVVRDLILAPP